MRGAWAGHKVRLWGVLGILTLALGACAGDPADYGITGPHPDGAAPSTLKRPDLKSERSDDTMAPPPTTEAQHAPPAVTPASRQTERYYGYRR